MSTIAMRHGLTVFGSWWNRYPCMSHGKYQIIKMRKELEIQNGTLGNFSFLYSMPDCLFSFSFLKSTRASPGSIPPPILIWFHGFYRVINQEISYSKIVNKTTSSSRAQLVTPIYVQSVGKLSIWQCILSAHGNGLTMR